MASLPETETWEAGIYQLETTDPVEGGEGGVANTPHEQLGNRTAYLKDALEDYEGQASGAHAASAISALVADWLAAGSVHSQLAQIPAKLGVQTAGDDGAKKIGCEQQTGSSGGKTTTVGPAQLDAVLAALCLAIATHRGQSAAGADHDALYPRSVDTTTYTIGTSTEQVFYTIPGGKPDGPHPVSVYYEHDAGGGARWYLAGTGPRAADITVSWVASNRQLAVKNESGSTALKVRCEVLGIWAQRPRSTHAVWHGSPKMISLILSNRLTFCGRLHAPPPPHRHRHMPSPKGGHGHGHGHGHVARVGRGGTNRSPRKAVGNGNLLEGQERERRTGRLEKLRVTSLRGRTGCRSRRSTSPCRCRTGCSRGPAATGRCSAGTTCRSDRRTCTESAGHRRRRSRGRSSTA